MGAAFLEKRFETIAEPADSGDPDAAAWLH
jgi:hypothetical protein